jgi:hypothetical protein
VNFYGAVFVLVIGFAAVVVAVMPYIRHRQQREDFELYLHDWAKPAAERFVPVAEVSGGPPWAITPRYVGADGAPDWTAAELDRLAVAADLTPPDPEPEPEPDPPGVPMMGAAATVLDLPLPWLRDQLAARDADLAMWAAEQRAQLHKPVICP